MARKKNTPVKEAAKPVGAEVPENKTDYFPIVGIGASAGGLSAFENFFSGMPDDKDPDMAFVLVQHLAPDHKSILSDLIRRYTRMQVFEVEDGMKVCPNCAYIIPPNFDMAFLNGTLQLLKPAAPRGQRMPIDFFFRSLAQDQRERAIGIVLSGTGSDGTLGVRAIKGEGGMAMAQDPASTEFDGMPRSAIGTGMIDYQLVPAEMPARIIAYVAHALGAPSIVRTSLSSGVESALKKMFILIRAHTGHDFSQYKPSTILRRVERRMAVQQIKEMESYVRFMQQNLDEVEVLFRDILIGVTGFFRDPEVYGVLEEHVIPRIFEGKPVDGTVRVWSTGCATGEEAYSLAILLAEQQEALKRSFRIQVFATDIDSQAISVARAGRYPANISADITPERLARFFTAEPEGGGYCITKGIRDMLVFSEQNVIKDPPFSKLDLICCRNLLIYLSGDLQKKLIPLFHYALNPDGFLFLGTSETVGEFGKLFSVVNRKAKIYQRKEYLYHMPPGGFMPRTTADREIVIPVAARTSGAGKVSLRDLAEQALLREVAPAAALVKGNGDILYLHGRTGMFLEPAQGEAGFNNIIRMAREGLKHDLVTALHKASGGDKSIRLANLRVKTNGDFTTVNLTVCPVTTAIAGQSGEPLFMVIMEQQQDFDNEPEIMQKSLQTPEKPDISEAESNDSIESLRKELRTKEEYLQTAIEELETSNEELKSSNEEMQSVNEELQSTNEELETSKEEMQSVNEELATVNEELQTKVADLSRAINDMNNLLSGTNQATIFLDLGMRILRFTPAAVRLINLIQSDIGRPVGHIVANITGYDDLIKDTREVLETLVPKEIEVQSIAGACYKMRIQPYRTLDNVIEGAVVTFVDISGEKQAREALLQSESRCRLALKGSSAILAHVDRNLRYTWVRDPDPDFDPESVIGKRDDEIADSETARKLVSMKKQVIETAAELRETVTFIYPEGERTYDIFMEPLKDDHGEVTGATSAAFDISGGVK